MASAIQFDLVHGKHEGWGVIVVMHGHSRMLIDPRIPAMPGRITSGFPPTRPTLLAPSTKRREVLDESHEG